MEFQRNNKDIRKGFVIQKQIEIGLSHANLKEI